MQIKEILSEKSVESSWITDLTFNRSGKILTMRISNGKYYTIRNITRTIFERWVLSPSKGQFFQNFIRDNYPVKRLK